MAPLDDVLSIPGNEYVLGRLRELLTAEQAIAFVGPGTSAGLYPVGAELIRELADQVVRRGLATDADHATWLRAANPQQAVRAIQQNLGQKEFGALLRKTFRYRTGQDGNGFTRVDDALMRLRFRGYVTINYDPGLLQARRMRRPDVVTTGYATWQDSDSLGLWLTGDVFDEQPCPILYAHGIYERSETIVLGAEEYRKAYQPGLFHRLVDKLWSQERLVFVGFSFSDPWFDVIADQVLSVTAHQTAGEARHVAVVGLSEGEDYSAEVRRQFRDAYDAEVLLYPVGVREQDGARGEDHGLLVAILDELAGPVPPLQVGQDSASDDRGVEKELLGDVVLQVDRTDDDRYRFQLLGEVMYPPELSGRLTINSEQVVDAITAEFERMADRRLPPATQRNRTRNLGAQLWADVVPEAVRQQFWMQVDRIRSFTVVSDVDLPWELLYPIDGDNDRGFLVEQFPVVRRMHGQVGALQLPITSAAFVVPPDSPSDALDEVLTVRARLGGGVADRGTVKRLKDLLELLDNVPPNVLHFVSYDLFADLSGPMIRMSEGPFRPIDLTLVAQKRSLAAVSALVFLSVCRTTGVISGPTHTMKWAHQFMRAGAGAFLGSSWAVRSNAARSFVDAFYQAFVTQRLSLGEASLEARRAIADDDGDPTWLAYMVYGNPSAKVSELG